MNDLIIFLAIGLVFALLFWLFSLNNQNRRSERWLRHKLTNPDIGSDEKQQLSCALDSLLTKKTSNRPLLPLMFFGLLVVPVSLLLNNHYLQQEPLQNTNPAKAQQANDMETAIAQLEQKLQQNPDNLEGVLLYARSMISVNRYSKAVLAFRQANKLLPNDAVILTELAEAIAFEANTGSFAGEPEELLAKALQLNPNHQKALWLQGINYFEQKQYEQAENYWTTLLTLVQKSSIRNTLVEQINKARLALNKPPLESKNKPAKTPLLTVIIDIGENLKNSLKGTNPVLFLSAKQVNGPPIPIAAQRLNMPFDFPVTITLGDNNSLNPDIKLSQFDQYKISAKISFSGTATPNKGDIISTETIVSKDDLHAQLLLNKKIE